MSSWLGTGAYKVCPVCGKTFFCEPEYWVYKREDNHSAKHQKRYFCCSWKCLRLYDAQHEQKLFELRMQAALRRQKKRIERRRRQNLPDDSDAKRKKAQRNAEIDALIYGRMCQECRYFQRDKFGFPNCTFQYRITKGSTACRRFKPNDQEVRYG